MLEFVLRPWHLIVLFVASQLNREQQRVKSGERGGESPAAIASAACSDTTIVKPPEKSDLPSCALRENSVSLILHETGMRFVAQERKKFRSKKSLPLTRISPIYGSSNMDRVF